MTPADKRGRSRGGPPGGKPRRRPAKDDYGDEIDWFAELRSPANSSDGLGPREEPGDGGRSRRQGSPPEPPPAKHPYPPPRGPEPDRHDERVELLPPGLAPERERRPRRRPPVIDGEVTGEFPAVLDGTGEMPGVNLPPRGPGRPPAGPPPPYRTAPGPPPTGTHHYGDPPGPPGTPSDAPSNKKAAKKRDKKIKKDKKQRESGRNPAVRPGGSNLPGGPLPPILGPDAPPRPDMPPEPPRASPPGGPLSGMPPEPPRSGTPPDLPPGGMRPEPSRMRGPARAPDEPRGAQAPGEPRGAAKSGRSKSGGPPKARPTAGKSGKPKPGGKSRVSGLGRSQVRAQLRQVERLRLATLALVTFVLLGSLPGFFLIKYVTQDPGFRAMDALELPAWAARNPVDQAVGSRWCIQICRIRHRVWESRRDLESTVEAYQRALQGEGWKRWEVIRCPAHRVRGDYTCWRRDAFTLDLWARPSDCQDAGGAESEGENCPEVTVTVVIRNAGDDGRLQ